MNLEDENAAERYMENLEKNDAVGASDSMALVSADQNSFEVPESVAVCPYCKAKLSVTVEGCQLHDDGWRADSITTECHNEPYLNSKEWRPWLNQHSYMPYVYQLPVDNKIIDWLNKRYRFNVEC